MTINELNGRVINGTDVNIHDDVLEKFYFDRLGKKLHLSIEKQGIKREKFSIYFIHVIGFSMTCCDFWGSSPHILDFEYVERDEREMIPKLFQMKSGNLNPYCGLSNQEEYIETVITFTSGDRLTVACESIII